MELTYDFPVAIDNTMRTCWDACPRKFLLSHIYNLRASDPSIHLVFGASYAKGLEVARREYYGGNTERASYLGKAYKAAIREWESLCDELFLDQTKSMPTMLCAIEYYFTEYPMENDWLAPLLGAGEEPAIEFTFAIPLPYAHPSGDPVLYTGRFDMFVTFGDVPAVYDDKTTGSLGASWIKGWELDSQLTGYIWAGQQHGFDCSTALLRGVSILTKSFGTAQAIQHRTKFEVSSWLSTMQSNLVAMLTSYHVGEDAFLPSYGQACKAYGGCPYVSLCKKENWQEWIEPEFHHYVWNPLDIKSQEKTNEQNTTHPEAAKAS